MCRLAYIPFCAKEEDKLLVDSLFRFLEVSFGGHGNGIGYFHDRKPFIFKGARLSADDTAENLTHVSRPAIFHTRMASMGSICDENCHPFSYNGVLTAHNGHWMDAQEMAKMLIHAEKFSHLRLNDLTDSEVVACLIGNYGFGATNIVDSGVILSLYQDHAKVYVKGDFEVVMLPDGRFLYASEFPKNIIDDFDIKYYMKFMRGSIAKLTEDGPILVSGELNKTVPSLWPSHRQGYYGAYGNHPYSQIWDDYCQEKLPVSASTRTSFLPKRKGKKAKKRPYSTWEIMREVKKHIGFEDVPMMEELIETTPYLDVESSLAELEEELDRVLGSGLERRFLAQEANTTVMAWIRVNESSINALERVEAGLEGSLGLRPVEQDSFMDDYGNVWIFQDDAWQLLSDINTAERQKIRDAEWKAVE